MQQQQLCHATLKSGTRCTRVKDFECFLQVCTLSLCWRHELLACFVLLTLQLGWRHAHSSTDTHT